MGMTRDRLTADKAKLVAELKHLSIQEICDQVGVSEKQVKKILSGEAYTRETKLSDFMEFDSSERGRKSSTGEKGVAKFRDKFRVVVKGEYIGVYCTLEQAVFARDAALNSKLV